MRLKARRDANHKEIVDYLHRIGFSVLDLAAVGHGCPDVLVGMASQNILCEIKDGNKPPSARQLTPDQVEFISTWHGKVIVITSTADCDVMRNLLLWPKKEPPP